MLRNKIYATWLDSAQPVPDSNAGKEAQKKEKSSLEGIPMNEIATLPDRVIMYVGAFFFLGGWPVSQDTNSPQMTRAPVPLLRPWTARIPNFGSHVTQKTTSKCKEHTTCNLYPIFLRIPCTCKSLFTPDPYTCW